MDLGKAIEVAVTAHSGQVDKGGKPYILHPMWVMNKVRHLGPDFMTAAILHDVVEDSSLTIEGLITLGFNQDVIAAVRALTHDHQNMSYEDYIKSIKNNTIATAVKLRDIEHNSKITRLKGLRPQDFERLAKYHRAYIYLKN